MNCKFCGATGLHWDTHETGSRLFHADGRLHSCSYKSPKSTPDVNAIRTVADLEAFTHWKVGDTMDLQGQEFEIGAMAVLEEPADKRQCRVVYFDTAGKCRGWQKMNLYHEPKTTTRPHTE